MSALDDEEKHPVSTQSGSGSSSSSSRIPSTSALSSPSLDGGSDSDDERGILDSDDEEMEIVVTLVSQTQEKFKLPRRFCRLSEHLQNVIELDKFSSTIALPKLSSSQISKVIEYLSHFGRQDEPPVVLEPPIDSGDLVKIAGAWSADFVDISQAELFELFLASNYLAVRPLVALCAAKIACDMHEKSPSEILKMYNIREDYTEDEELKIRRQYRDFIE